MLDIAQKERDTDEIRRILERTADLETLHTYYRGIAESYPEKTLQLFKTTADRYIKEHVGRTHYEYITCILRAMQQIKGGKECVAMMIHDYREKYKNWRVMLEILSRFEF